MAVLQVLNKRGDGIFGEHEEKALEHFCRSVESMLRLKAAEIIHLKAGITERSYIRRKNVATAEGGRGDGTINAEDEKNQAVASNSACVQRTFLRLYSDCVPAEPMPRERAGGEDSANKKVPLPASRAVAFPMAAKGREGRATTDRRGRWAGGSSSSSTDDRRVDGSPWREESAGKDYTPVTTFTHGVGGGGGDGGERERRLKNSNTSNRRRSTNGGTGELGGLGQKWNSSSLNVDEVLDRRHSEEGRGWGEESDGGADEEEERQLLDLNTNLFLVSREGHLSLVERFFQDLGLMERFQVRFIFIFCYSLVYCSFVLIVVLFCFFCVVLFCFDT